MIPLPVTSSRDNRCLAEMREFAGFPDSTQRYIRRSLDVARNGVVAAGRWSRDANETASIVAQAELYAELDTLKETIPDGLEIGLAEALLGRLITLSLFDLAQYRIPDFPSYRFLYERLLGAAVRPWLVPAFLAAATMPTLHPLWRGSLVQSLRRELVTAVGWSCLEPSFMPVWIERNPVAEAD